MPLPRQQLMYSDPTSDYETAMTKLSGFTGIGEKPSVMSPDARKAYSEYDAAGFAANALSQLSGLGVLGGLRQLLKAPSAARGYGGPALSNLSRQELTSDQVQKVRELLNPHTGVGTKATTNQQVIANYFPGQMEDYPETMTRMFLGEDGVPRAAYQVTPKADFTYIPNIVSFEGGYGHQALDDAYNLAKSVAPKKPVSLYSLPDKETLAFYRRQGGWKEDMEDGINRFTKKANGGLVQMKECNCGH